MADTLEMHSKDGHLSYYKKFGLSPVRYDLRNLQAHFDRRGALYRSLGLPPVAFKGVRVLEVAAGSGQNSLYVAVSRPAEFDLVEPNPVGIADISAAYAGLDLPHTAPCLHEVMLQDFHPARPYDIVLCENWLGMLPSDRALIRKLASLVAPGGTFVLTIVPMSGFVPNVVRKILADLLVEADMSFEQRSDLLVQAFSPHLATIRDMTRSHRDWVHDCMLNPHYLNVALPLDIVLQEVGDDLESLSCNPNFHTDWRWFKSLHGEGRAFNQAFRRSYFENVHNFIDYERCSPPRDVALNEALDAVCTKIHTRAVEIESELAAATLDKAHAARRLSETLAEALPHFHALSPDLGAAFDEVARLAGQPTVTVSDVAGMQAFARLFGRETLYTSFTRPA